VERRRLGILREREREKKEKKMLRKGSKKRSPDLRIALMLSAQVKVGIVPIHQLKQLRESDRDSFSSLRQFNPNESAEAIEEVNLSQNANKLREA
jgi:hypothetical protein